MSRLWGNGSGFSTRLIDTRSSGAMRTSERVIVIRASACERLTQETKTETDVDLQAQPPRVRAVLP